MPSSAVENVNTDCTPEPSISHETPIRDATPTRFDTIIEVL